MLWIGAVEDAKSIDDVITSASITVDSTPTNTAHTAQYSLFTSAECIARAWLKSHRLQCHLCASEKSLSSGQHMPHPLLFSHLPCTTSTSSSSFTLPSTNTPEHALQVDNTIHSKNIQMHHQSLAWKPREWRKSAQHLLHNNRKTSSGLRESWFQDCKLTRWNPCRKLQETSHQSRRQSSIW